MDEERPTTHGRALLYHLKRSARKLDAVVYHEETHHPTRKLRSLPLVVVLLLGVCIIGLHAAAMVALVTMKSSALSLRDPIAILVIGLLVIIAVFKLTHALGFTRTKRITEAPVSPPSEPSGGDKPGHQ